MALHLNTEQVGGETEGSSSANKPTLKEFISKELAQIPNLYDKLTTELDMTEIDDLIFLDDNDKNEICTALGLSLKHKIKFKKAVGKLQLAFKPKQQQQHTIVTISPKAQSAIDQFNNAITQSNDIQHLFEAHFNQIDETITNTKTQIDATIDSIIQILNNRKKSLYQKVDEWKINKLENVNKEIANIMEYHNALKKSKRSIDDLLKKTGVSKRDEKIMQISHEMFGNNDKFKVYQDTKLLQQYIVNSIKLSSVVFQEMMNMKELGLFGELDKNVESNTFKIPSIVLDDVVKTEQNEDGCKFKLKWKLLSDEEHKSNDFEVKYVLQNIENDEKKDEISSGSSSWMTLRNSEIKKEENSKYSVATPNYFKYNNTYEFQIEYMIQKPLNMKIQSNVKSIAIVMEQLLDLNMSKEEQIPLRIHSHKGHQDSYPPERMLKSNGEYYLSTHSQVTNDWIIMETNDNNGYYPTKIELRGDSNSNHLVYGPKRFTLKIGSSSSNEWVNCNQQLFTGQQKENQTFNLDIICDNKINKDLKIQQTWKSMKQKQFKQFKLEILDNLGHDQWLLITEFKLFGIKM